MKFYETKQFKELEKEWDENLDRSGFCDIEKKMGTGRELKQFSQNVHRRSKSGLKQAREKYFERLSECFQTEIFLDYKILSDFISGKKRSEIWRELILLGANVDYETIRFIIRRYEYKWGIKNYTLRQMNLRRLPIR